MDMANIMDWKIATTILWSCNCASFEPEFFGKVKSPRDNLNRLRVKITKQEDVSLAKLPPCEASFAKNEDVVSQPVKACTAGNNLHTRGPWIWQISWTGR
jgi:hypothetical protein